MKISKKNLMAFVKKIMHMEKKYLARELFAHKQ